MNSAPTFLYSKRTHFFAQAVCDCLISGAVLIDCGASKLLAQAGVLDPSFDPVVAAAPGDAPVIRAIAKAPGNKLLIGGSFFITRHRVGSYYRSGLIVSSVNPGNIFC